MDLKILGLTKYEGAIYETLTKIGTNSAPTISKESGVPYGRVYDVLVTLQQKGLVILIPEKVKKYAPSSPKAFKEIIKKKMLELEELNKNISQLQEYYGSQVIEPITLVGKRNFYKVMQELPQAKKYDYSIKYNCEYNAQWIKKAKKDLKKGIDMKTLTRYNEETKKDVKKWAKANPNMRVFENKEAVIMNLIDDKFAFLTLIKSNINLVFKDPNIILFLKKMFLSMYEQAEKINVNKTFKSLPIKGEDVKNIKLQKNLYRGGPLNK